MNWLKLRLRNWVNSAYDSDVEYAGSKRKSNAITGARDSKELDGEPLRFNIFRANGGTVVQTHVYDRQKDRNFQQLHIVGHDQDLGESLGKIITMESMKL